MIAAEEDAKRLWWCPLAQMRAGDVAGFNRSIVSPWRQVRADLLRRIFPRWHWHAKGKFGRCLGTGCAIWRWHAPGRGYCGLADVKEIVK